MRRDTASDSVHYKPSLRHLAETNYWSDDNICRTEVNQVYNLWNTPLTKMTESKDQTISDAQLTPSQNNQSSQTDSNGKKLSVHFDESQNRSHSHKMLSNKKKINQLTFVIRKDNLLWYYNLLSLLVVVLYLHLIHSSYLIIL